MSQPSQAWLGRGETPNTKKTKEELKVRKKNTSSKIKTIKNIFEKEEIGRELEKTKNGRKDMNLRWEKVTGQNLKAGTLGPKQKPKLRKNDDLDRRDLGKKGVEEGLVVARSEKDAKKESRQNGEEVKDSVAKRRKIFENNIKDKNTTKPSEGDREYLDLILMSEKERRHFQKPLERKSEAGRIAIEGDEMKG